jgi:photosystem II stability/assembly factor-like uncharacterized protein/alpha-tubulin suppressor-like RCC1 family protein
MNTKRRNFAICVLILGLLISNCGPGSSSGPTRFVSIAAGRVHTCGLTSGGGVKCWGDNSYGQLGDGTTTQRFTPVDVIGLTSGVRAIASSGLGDSSNYTCALTSGGGVKCWGANENGELGDGTRTRRLTPVDVKGLTKGIRAIAIGSHHTCALTSGGEVKCWGLYSESGSIPTPTDVSGLAGGVKAISAGMGYTCALTSSGGVKCWGGNTYGVLGGGTLTARQTTVNVSGLTSGVTAITASGLHTCALTSGGGVKCWGYNWDGQLGDGTYSIRAAPVDVRGLTDGVAAISGGYAHTCALTSGGGVQCWGDNGFGQLGDGTHTDRAAPVDVRGLTKGVKAIFASGANFTCALTSDDEFKCWGNNFFGGMPFGTNIQALNPADVRPYSPNPPPYPDESPTVAIVPTVVLPTAIPTASIPAGVLTSLGPLPEGGLIRDLVVNPQTPTMLYAATQNAGLFKTDAAGNWHALNKGLTDTDIWSLAIDPQMPTTLYAGADNGDLFKSTDGGESWRLLSQLDPSGILTLLINPMSPTTLYARTGSGNILKSMDGGQNWNRTGLPKKSVFYALAIDPTTPNTLYAGRGGDEKLNGVYKTTNGGETWSRTGPTGANGNSVTALAIDPTTPGTIYAGTDLNGVFKTRDGGGTWSAINAGLPPKTEINNLIIDPKMPGTLYAGTLLGAQATPGSETGIPGLFKSTDGGAHWNAVNTGVSGTSISTLKITEADSLYAAIYPFGLFKSTDGGGTWSPLGSPINTNIDAVGIDRKTPALYVMANGDDTLKSTDGGASWRPINIATDTPALVIQSLAFDPTTPTTLYAGTFAHVFKSMDGGESWSPVRGNGIPGDESFLFLYVDRVTPSTIYAATTDDLFKSTDGGANWHSLNLHGLGLMDNTQPLDLAIDPTSPTTLYVTIYSEYILKSTDGGANWRPILSGLGKPMYVSFLEMDPKMHTTLYLGDESQLFKSTDSGENWSAITAGLPSRRYIAFMKIDPANSSILYAGVNGGLFESTNGGKDWYGVNTGLTNFSISSMAIDPSMPGTLYLGTSGGGLFSLKQTK